MHLQIYMTDVSQYVIEQAEETKCTIYGECVNQGEVDINDGELCRSLLRSVEYIGRN